VRIARHVAHHLARRVIERLLQAQGLLVAHVPYAKISALARAYLEGHQELLDQAAEIVRTHPAYREFVEREERERERQQRKSMVVDRAVS
jgi:hypothetical protein